MRAKYRHFLEDRSIRRWYENIARGSRITADVYLRRLGNTCERLRLTPSQLAEMGEEELHALLLDYISLLEREGRAGSYIESVIKALRSWLAHNGAFIRRKIKIKGVRETPTLKDERTPTPEELRRILLSGDKKTRAACALVAFSGLRIEVLGNYRGTDGLRLGDIPDLVIAYGAGAGTGIGTGTGTGAGTGAGAGAGTRTELDAGTITASKANAGAEASAASVSFARIPAMVVVRRELSKAGHQYFTFLSKEGCEYLKDYLEERLRHGEVLTPDSPVIRPKTAKKPFIRSTNISDIIRLAIRKAGFPWRPYVLRSYFDTQLMVAESRGVIIRDYRQFFMGHKGDIENRYTTNKCRLPENVVEDMRGAYARSAYYLESAGGRTSEEELNLTFRKQLLLMVGLKPEEIERMNVASMTDEEFREAARNKFMGMMMNNGSRQKVVPVSEIEKHIAEGWEFVAAIPDGKAVMRIPF